MKIYAGNTRTLTTSDKPGCKEWGDIYNVLANSVVLVDRTQNVVTPFNVELYHKFVMPTDIRYFDDTFEQCCDRRALELYNLSRELDKPIYLLYSGGIDSTLALISLLKVIPENDRQRLIVSMNMTSVKEYPYMYYTHIRGKLKTVSSDSFSKAFDKSCIIVGGEHADQLFGSDIVNKLANVYDFDSVLQRYNRKNITDFFKSCGMEQGNSDIWFDIIDESCKDSPAPLSTVFDFLWWLNFNFKWQAVFFRLLIRCDKEHQQSIDQEFVDTYYHHFYSQDYFQLWSINNQDKKIKQEWSTYKFIAKEIIYDYTKDEEYKLNKTKLQSLYQLIQQKKTPQGLTTDYNFLYELDANELYVPNNSFIGKQVIFE